MVDSVNLNNLSVDDKGRVRFSGVGSGIDFVGAVDNIIAARRIPVDRLEAKSTENSDKIAAFDTLKGLMNSLATSVNNLRGRVTFGNTGDVFASKEVFASATSSIGTASAAGNLLGVSVTNAAEAGSHTIEVLQTATSHKLSADTAVSRSINLGLAYGEGTQSISGAFEINGRRITVQPTDTLIDLKDRINTANSGASATGVTASIVSVSATQHVLVLTADKTGESIEIAKSHRLGGATVSSTSDDLGTALGLGAGSVAGSFEVNGVQVDVDAADTLTSLVEKINAAGAGVTASVLTENGVSRLAITTNDASQDIVLSNETGGVLADLGLSNDGGATFTSVLSDSNDVLAKLGISSDGGATFENELRQAQTAKFRADGLLDISASQAVGVANATTAYGTTGTLSIEVPGGGSVDLAVGAGDTPETIRDAINADATLQAAGISASIVTDSSGKARLEIRQEKLTAEDPGGVLALKLADSDTTTIGIDDTLTFSFGEGQIAQIAVSSGDTLEAVRDAINADPDLQAAGVSAQVVSENGKYRLAIQHDADIDVSGPAGLGLQTPELIIERSSNTVSDVFNGVTLTLFQAEPGTTVKLDVEQNLSQAKDDILAFVEAYNAVKSFINEQRLKDPETGGKSKDAGPLYGNPTLTNIEVNLARVVGQGAEGLSSGFQVLRSIGVEFVDNNSLDDPLLNDTLQVDETVLDEKLLNDPAAVKKLFAFDFSSSDPQVALLGFAGTTKVANGGYSLDVTMSNGVITGATINGVPGSATVSGNTITATDKTGAQGLKIVYTGTDSASDVQLNISSGVGSNLFYEVQRMLDQKTGSLALESQNLTAKNEANLKQIDRMVERLNYQREQMLQRFVAMEEALLSMNNTLDAIRQQMEALSRDN